MPLYSYDCLECKKNFTVRHPYGASNISCSSCQSENIKKNLSGVLRVTKKCYNTKEVVGNQVIKAIEDGKKGLKKYQKEQQNRVYKKEQ